MRKAEAEAAFQQMFRDWAEAKGINVISPQEHYSFSEFCNWVEAKHYSHYFNFRSGTSARDDVERWFDQHFKQMWRN